MPFKKPLTKAGGGISSASVGGGCSRLSVHVLGVGVHVGVGIRVLGVVIRVLGVARGWSRLGVHIIGVGVHVLGVGVRLLGVVVTVPVTVPPGVGVSVFDGVSDRIGVAGGGLSVDLDGLAVVVSITQVDVTGSCGHNGGRVGVVVLGRLRVRRRLTTDNGLCDGNGPDILLPIKIR